MKGAALLAALTLAARAAPAQAPAVPQVTLEEAIRRATQVDPQVVIARGSVRNAEWARRQALLAFVLPSLTASLDATRFSTDFFNIGIGRPTNTQVNARLNAAYELLSVRKLTEPGRTRAELEAAEGDAEQQRYRTALLTEGEYYDVLAARELLRVADERLRRAEEQLAVARARVLSGAAVQSDSLQLVSEVVNARTAELRQRVALRVARLQLGRRIGAEGPVDAAPIDTTIPPALPLTREAAVGQALELGPQYRAARARERAAGKAVRARVSDYFPTINLSAANTRFDDRFFPSGRIVSQVQVQVVVPLWNFGNRELAVRQAKVNHDVASALKADLERAAARDVTEAYDGYDAAREAEALAAQALAAARETFRVQDLRYRAGATTILDLLTAQLGLVQAEGQVVQARYATRLALAGLETILGRPLDGRAGTGR